MDDLTRSLLSVADRPDQIAALYQHLRQFCHFIRNRLNCFKLNIYLARQGAPDELQPRLAALEQHYLALERFVDRFHNFCRPLDPDQLTRLRATLGMLLEERRSSWAALLTPRGIALDWNPPPSEPYSLIDSNRLGDALDHFVAWRSQRVPDWSTVRVGWGARGGSLAFDWEEQASPADPEPETHRPPRPVPSCLASALLGRLVLVHGGTLEQSEQGPCLHLTIRLPLSSPLDGTGTREPVASPLLRRPDRETGPGSRHPLPPGAVPALASYAGLVPNGSGQRT